MLKLLPLPFAAVMTLLMSVTSASATILPLDKCVGSLCSWDPAGLTADPTTGDIWIKFESTPRAGDMGHIEGHPNEPWTILIGGSVPGIQSLFETPFLTDMDQPIPETQVVTNYLTSMDFLDFEARFIESVFVHDIHWRCDLQNSTPSLCFAASQSLIASIDAVQISGAQFPLITGIWDVPEPGTLAIFGLGLAGLGFARRKKAA